jgi:hypothetical protein
LFEIIELSSQGLKFKRSSSDEITEPRDGKCRLSITISKERFEDFVKIDPKELEKISKVYFDQYIDILRLKATAQFEVVNQGCEQLENIVCRKLINRLIEMSELSPQVDENIQ